MLQLFGYLSLFRTSFRVALKQKIRYPAAALAYYAFVSFAPLLVLTFAAVGRPLAVEFSRVAPSFLTPPVRKLVTQSITTANGRTGAGVLAVLVLGWCGANAVGDIRTVIEQIEGTAQNRLRDLVRDSVVILGSIGLALLAVATTSILFALPPAGPLVELASFFGLWVTLAVVFVPLYYVPSRVVATPRAALPGALTASFGWTVLNTALHFYSTHAGQYAIYGVLSGIVILLTSFYLAASLLLTGIIVNDQRQTESSL
ncbi:membrane protein [Halogranum rubrum]|uniref:Membrane protein n=1 Tax=Halogranum rubrum TaxID=553466 RepID=A0A1I4B8D0_9EURY|nr:YhjD/YihY/BrkB family envelope integrity protein [Halogranum rubrum]SFK64590.1 membrane protein [Halogranum rubrum]